MSINNKIAAVFFICCFASAFLPSQTMKSANNERILSIVDFTSTTIKNSVNAKASYAPNVLSRISYRKTYADDSFSGFRGYTSIGNYIYFICKTSSSNIDIVAINASDPANPRIIETVKIKNADVGYGMDFVYGSGGSPGHTPVAGYGNSLYIVTTAPKYIIKYDINTDGSLINKTAIYLEYLTDLMTSISLNSDGSKIYAGGTSGNSYVIDAAAHAVTAQLSIFHSGQQIYNSGNFNYAVANDHENSKIKISPLDAYVNSSMSTANVGNSSFVSSGAVHGNYLAFGTYSLDYRVYVYNLSSPSSLKYLYNFTSKYPDALNITDNNLYVFSGSSVYKVDLTNTGAGETIYNNVLNETADGKLYNVSNFTAGSSKYLAALCSKGVAVVQVAP